ncbi:MAG: hypothetical protein COS85_17270 [Armatimonadetes bacterium CG07_land_8_20_14_0_80_59_28]|nr:MAG: hypothetical protein COS85_17270 [Armatimonadetes bacterium CG07_land_8_20_14_0_80_59_28]PIY39008.1 MAG: hypothetical protein COZ05_19840 [Armatimonadetes bacterium CG_4_10_14_3_um_filter_59_10]PJB62760.1 MAG: hypothetical protein CO095_17960 [Armatimonadetes bacterium CG_4_9_14_3_um_filter_58_7]
MNADLADHRGFSRTIRVNPINPRHPRPMSYFWLSSYSIGKLWCPKSPVIEGFLAIHIPKNAS